MTIIPKSAFQAIVSAANASPLPDRPDLYTVACGTISSLPPIIMKMGGHRIILTGIQQIFKVDDLCLLMFTEGKPSLGVDVILGAVFLRHFYTVFDFGEARVGLAETAGQSSFLPFGNGVGRVKELGFGMVIGIVGVLVGMLVH